MIKLINDRVLVKRDEKILKSKGGIHLEKKYQEFNPQGVVVAVGPGKKTKKGIIPMSLKKGDTVMISRKAIGEVKIDGEMLLDMRESQILGVVE